MRTAGDDLTAEIQEYMSRQHNVKVSERMAERIKIHVGSALTDLGEEAPEDYVVHGPNKITALPMENGRDAFDKDIEVTSLIQI